MTGADHYREAEALLDAAGEEHEGAFRESEAQLLVRAQVHATLALAASFG